MTVRKRVEAFKPRHEYRFIKDFTYDPGGVLHKVECKKGDVAIFRGRGLYAGFYVKDRNDPENRWWLVLLKPKDAFRLLDEA